MINLKALAIATTLSLSAMIGDIPSAKAGTCWFNNGRGSLSPSYCQTNRRINANGHVVFDIVDHRGDKLTLVLWTDGTAELLMNGGRQVGRHWYDRQGDLRLETNYGEMAVRL